MTFTVRAGTALRPDTRVAVLGYGDPTRASKIAYNLVSQGVEPAQILLLLNPDGQRHDPVPSAFRWHVFNSNVGYARAMNEAIRDASNAGLEFVVLLTHDVTVDAVALAQLADDLRSDQSLGAVGPLLYRRSSGDRWELFSAGGVLARHGQVAHTISTPAALADRAWLDGSVLAVRTSAAMQLSGFDDRYFLYVEDVDLCARLRRSGWRVAVDGRVGACSAPGGSERIAAFDYLVRRNLLETHRKAGDYRQAAALALTSLALRRRGRRKAPALRGSLDFVMRRFGPPPERMLTNSDIAAIDSTRRK